MLYDVIIIGAGVTGCAIARELSKTDRKVLVLEKASDVCEGTSKANSGIVHSGYDAKPGTMKARMNLRGNQIMGEWARELDFPFIRNGSLVLCFTQEDRLKLEKLLERGIENGVPGLRIVEREELLIMEPEIADHVEAALLAPTGGIVCPFNMTIAMAENAFSNGVHFRFNTEVTGIEKLLPKELETLKTHSCSSKACEYTDNLDRSTGSDNSAGYKVHTPEEDFNTRYIINAAGVYADVLHNMVSTKKLKITPRKGEYCLFDKKAGNLVSHTLFQLPSNMGKGVLVTPTVHGNLLMGPTAQNVEDPEETSTSAKGLSEVFNKAQNSVKTIPSRTVITSFAGLRAHEAGGDFIIGEIEDAPGFIDAAGIESPGLTSAPAIGEYVGKLLQELEPAPYKTDFCAHRKAIPSMALASEEEKTELIRQNPAYANVICRCEMVTEGEIMDAIHRPLGATTLDGIKRRTRAGMGRCQAGFCAPKQVEILARELGIDEAEITKAGGNSYFLTGINKGQEGGRAK